MNEPNNTRRTIRLNGPDPIDLHVGGRLRAARLLAGLSQQELGAGLRISFQATQKYETGAIRLSASRLFHAATLLDCSVSSFFEGLESIEGAGGTFANNEIQLVRSVRKITNVRVRDELCKLIKEVALASAGTSAAEKQVAGWK
jgi:transcriptional regulator with XRE-family HTH domain